MSAGCNGRSSYSYIDSRPQMSIVVCTNYYTSLRCLQKLGAHLEIKWSLTFLETPCTKTVTAFRVVGTFVDLNPLMRNVFHLFRHAISDFVWIPPSARNVQKYLFVL